MLTRTEKCDLVSKLKLVNFTKVIDSDCISYPRKYCGETNNKYFVLKYNLGTIFVGLNEREMLAEFGMVPVLYYSPVQKPPAIEEVLSILKVKLPKNFYEW